MAKSKFLPYQDTNGDGMIDVCDDLPIVVEECYSGCTPDPYAIVPLWHKRKIIDPFLNKKNCKYQITLTTPETTTGAPEGATEEEAWDALKIIFEQYEDPAINSLLEAYNKDKSTNSIYMAKAGIEYSDWYLDMRPKSRLKLLYSVPFDVMEEIPEAELEDDDLEEEPTDIVVTYFTDKLEPLLLKIRKGLHLYSRHYKVMQWQDNSFSFLKAYDDTLFNLEDYGDYGLLGRSITAELLPELENFLNSKGYAIPYIGGPNWLKEKVYKMEFTFDDRYRIKKLIIWTAACPNDPIVFIEGLENLRSRAAWSDETALAYFAHLDEMDVDLAARDPLDWIEFVKKYTHPEIYETGEYVYDETGLSCVGEALISEGKELGQDILDVAFGIGDAIAYQFHKNLCMCDPREAEDYMAEMNSEETIAQLAMAQAFEEMEFDENAFVRWCARNDASLGGMARDISSGMAKIDLRLMLDDLKVCGLLDLLTEAIECLMAGLSLEEGLAAILEAALEAMSIQNFGALYSFLPPEDQIALDELVNQKIQSGDIISDAGSAIGQASDDVVGNYPTVSMETLMADQEAIDKENENMVPDDYYYQTPAEYEERRQENTSTLAPTATGSIVETIAGGETEELNSNSILQLYIKSILELFKDRELELVDQLNKFPGAQLIANMLTAVACPTMPLFNPSFMDFIQDLEIPFICGKELTFPQFKALLLGTPFWKNPIQTLIDAAKEAMEQAYYEIIELVMKKLCEIIADAVCKALEVAGAVAVAALSPNNTIREAIKDAICGDDVDDETVDATIAEMFAVFGVGGEAFADTEALNNFTADISSASTRKEITEAFLGEPSDAFLAVVEGLIEFEYPQYGVSLSSRQSIGTMFKNMGNLMPASFRSDLREFTAALPENELVPANPSLCLTPEQIEQFCDLRFQLLEGRATPEQIQKLCDRQAVIDDLAALSRPIIPDMPQLISDPGCDNGLLPFEPEESIEAHTESLSSALEALKVQYSVDMLGNGPREPNWGLVNMTLSDTMGNPVTAHYRKANNRRKYTDFNVTYDPEIKIDLGIDGVPTLSDVGDVFKELGITLLTPVINMISGAPIIQRQRGAFPQFVAEYMAATMNSIDVEFESTNDWQDDIVTEKSFDFLELRKRNWGNVAILPDFGYNVEIEVDGDTEMVTFIEKGRKKKPDLMLNFEDNAKGMSPKTFDFSSWPPTVTKVQVPTMSSQSEFSYGFRIEAYFSDLEYHQAEFRGDYDGIKNILSDNIRIKIIDRINQKADVDMSLMAWIMDPQLREDAKKKNRGISVIEDEAYEFLATDDTLVDVEDLSEYTEFLSSFESHKSIPPQVYLLKDIINVFGTSPDTGTLKSYYDSFMSKFMGKFLKEIAANEKAFEYGAQFDDLVAEDAEYVVDDGQTESPGGTEYGDAEVRDPKDGELRKIRNRDMILGVSAMQRRVGEEKNRIFYLDPDIYGGSYKRPAIYMKPHQNKGWLGFAKSMFPDLSPCKPQLTDLVNFGDIQDMVNEVYSNMPEDDRLQQDPDCALEAPYNRILDRSAASGMQGLIIAAIRIYVSVHMLKSLATFSMFYPRFTEVFSSTYAAYIVENMEEGFKDAQPDFGERFNTFKDEEFWYSFLEQAVQMYGRRVESQDIEPTPAVLRALKNLNNMQEDYEFPTRDAFTNAKEDGATDRAFFKNYKSDENLKAVRYTEEDAKFILKELVVEQLNYMGEIFVKNLDAADMGPEIYDLDYYLLERLAQGSQLTVDQDIVPKYPDLPDSGDEHYTSGNEFVILEDINTSDEYLLGDEYIGPYHVYIDEQTGDAMYMAGEYHSDEEAHDVLLPMAHMTEVTCGDVSEYPYTDWSDSTEQPFVIEKYISINGKKYNPTEGQELIRENESTLNISDVYPGDLELVEDEDGNVTGLTGELGVRYGLLFSIVIDNRKYTLTEVEIDSLDLTIGEFESLGRNSKLLLCLVKHLKNDDRFKLVVKYIFSLTKLSSIAAIYNDMAFLPSIGEVTVGDGETTPNLGNYSDFRKNEKPGRFANVDLDGDGYVEDVSVWGNEGWASVKDRAPGLGGLFVREWDNWDQVLLRNSKRLIKRQFRNYYNSRDFSPAEIGGSKYGPGQVFMNKLKGNIFPSPGQRILPWWRRRKLRSNPFNANGDLCDHED